MVLISCPGFALVTQLEALAYLAGVVKDSRAIFGYSAPDGLAISLVVVGAENYG